MGGILMRLEKELDDAEKTIGERLHVIDLDNDGLISKAELEEVGLPAQNLPGHERLPRFCHAWGISVVR